MPFRSFFHITISARGYIACAQNIFLVTIKCANRRAFALFIFTFDSIGNNSLATPP